MSDTMTRFKEVRQQLQAAREASRLRYEWRDLGTQGRGDSIEDLAEYVATELEQKVYRAGDKWVSLANGRVLSHALMVRVVTVLLPPSIEGERREHLAGVLLMSATLRALLAGSHPHRGL